MNRPADLKKQVQELHQVAAVAREAAQDMSLDNKVLLQRCARDLEKRATILQRLLAVEPFIRP